MLDNELEITVGESSSGLVSTLPTTRKENPFDSLPPVSKEVLLKDVDPERLQSIMEKTRGLFPLLDDIKDMRTALKIVKNDLEALRQPFPYVEKHEMNMAFFNYNFMTWFTFGDLSKRKQEDEVSEIRRAAYLFARECRGICYDLKTGKIASRGLQKFFNVGEKPETEIENIDFSKDHIIVDKMDGTMVCSILASNDKLNDDNKKVVRFRTKMGWITDPSKYTEEFVYGTNDESVFPIFDITNDEYRLTESQAQAMEKGHKGYVEFSAYWIKKGYSPIFEFVSPKNQIVLLYEKPSLVLLALRHNYDGHYLSYEETKKSCDEFGVSFTEPLLQMTNETSLEKVQNFIKEQIGVEGYVVRFVDGTMYKIKSMWYLELHSCKTSNKKITDTDIWNAVLDNTIDDIQSNLQAKETKQELEEFVSNFWNAITILTQKVKEVGSELKQKYPVRKEYFSEGCVPLQATNKMFSELVSMYYNVKEEKLQDEIIASITKRLKPTVGNKKKMKNDVLVAIKESIEQVTNIDLTIFRSKYLEEKKRYDENLRLRREQKQASQPQIYDDNE
ncbi:hypothetical protein C9374_004869 [Naegleria lovaniensis]|uniref:T4 RNA ligase 1-like N-terminal domain-containing protein n=1 Tax=Naegleria lovaniensis TaxID=51637 RepID=A0AA88GQZ4_NAELO|nr:uncharacterized protein C9374_004869 [Naegleria lovaniensis]KAG2382902.1 hypothetical protein C9374_004869 [Naegleria lovaniensis]